LLLEALASVGRVFCQRIITLSEPEANLAIFEDMSTSMESINIQAGPESAMNGLISGMMTEGLLFLFFCLGFIVFRMDLISKFLVWCSFLSPHSDAKDAKLSSSTEEQAVLCRHLNFAIEADDTDGIFTLMSRIDPVSISQLESAVKVCVAKQKFAQTAQMVQDTIQRCEGLATAKVCNLILELVAFANPVAFTDTWAAFRDQGVTSDEGTAEIVLMAHAAHPSLVGRVPRLLDEMRSNGETVSARTYKALIQGALRQGNFERSLRFGGWMRDAGFSQQLDTDTIVQMSRLACRNPGHSELFVEFLENLGRSAPGKAINNVLDKAVQNKDFELLQLIDQGGLSITREGKDLLMRGLAMANSPRALELFDEMSQRGSQLPEGILVTLISISAESRNVGFAQKALAYAEEHGITSLPILSAMMKVYWSSNIPEKACDLYEKLRVAEIEPDAPMYGMLIKAAVACNRFEFARELFHKSRQPDLQNYMALMRAAAKEKNLGAALSILSDLEASSLHPDISAYNRALDACVSCEDLKEARNLFDRMRSQGDIDVISYNTLLKGLGANDCWAEAESLLQEMRSKGLKPNCVTYNSLINAAIQKENPDLVWNFVEDMARQGVAVDEYTCSILIKGLRQNPRREDVDRVLRLVEGASNVALDDVLYNTLLDCCVRLKDVPRCKHLLWKHSRKAIATPSAQTCGTLIRAYGFIRQLDNAWGVWYDMRDSHGLEYTDVTFGCMIEACVSTGAMDEAIQLFQDLKDSFPDKNANSHIYSLLIKGFAQRKEMRRALQVFKEMKDNELNVGVVTYNTLIDACARVGEMQHAAELFTGMCASGIEPDLITYSTIIKGYCVQGDLEKGLQLFSIMQKKGIRPDAILFNSILDGCAKRQMRSLTETVLNDMEVAGIAPSNVTLSILIKLYGRCRDLDEAFRIIEEYPARYNFIVNPHVQTCLMSACIANNNLDKAKEIYKQMSTNGVVIDAKTYETVINGCLKLGDITGAVEIIDEVLASDVRPIPLDSELLANVLFMIQRKHLAEELGVPLAQRLRAAGLEVPQQALGGCMLPERTSGGASSTWVENAPGARSQQGNRVNLVQRRAGQMGRGRA
jgi:pentatricopeptide repeat protein